MFYTRCYVALFDMNITESIGQEIGQDVASFLKKTPEIQIYANSNINRYQWRDGRYKETCDVWSNEDYASRMEMRTALMEYLKSKGDF